MPRFFAQLYYILLLIIIKQFMQGVCQLLEPKLTIRCRQADQGIVQSVLASAVASVKDKIKMDTELTLDTETYLPADG